MDEQKMVVFRSAFRGFNKNDVNAYIYNENKKFSETVENYKHEAETLKKNVEDANRIILKKESEAVSLKKKYDELLNEKSALNDSLKAECDELKAQLRVLKSSSQSCSETSPDRFIKITKIIDEQNLEIECLKKEIEKFRKNSLSYKISSNSENISDKYERTLKNEEIEAEAIIKDAEIKASKIIKTAKEEAEKIRKDFIKDHLVLIDSISGEIHEASQICINETNACLSKLRNFSSAMIEDIESTKREMNGKIRYFCSSMKESVNIKLKNFDVQHGVSSADNQIFREDSDCEKNVGNNRK